MACTSAGLARGRASVHGGNVPAQQRRAAFVARVAVWGATAADLSAEHNAQKLKIACYATIAHKRATITANP